MPTIATHVPEDWELAEEFARVVREDYRGKPGPYVRDVIERDLRGLGLDTPRAAYSIEDVARGRAAERALLGAERIARDLAWAEGERKMQLARALAEHVMNATRAVYPVETDEPGAALLVAEADALAASEQAKRGAGRESGRGRRR